MSPRFEDIYAEGSEYFTLGSDPIAIHKARMARKEALIARVARFADDDRETDALSQKIKAESWNALVASALEEALEDCSCDVVSTWIETSDGIISVCAPRPPKPPRSSLVASAQASGQPVEEFLSHHGIDLCELTLFNSQRKTYLSSLVAAADPPLPTTPEHTGDPSNPHAITTDPAHFNFTDLSYFDSFPTPEEEAAAQKALERFAEGLSDEAADALAANLPTPIPEPDSVTAATYYETQHGGLFRGRRQVVMDRIERLFDLAAHRKARKGRQELRDSMLRAYVDYENANYRISGITYFNGLQHYFETTTPAHPSNLKPNIPAWNRMLRNHLGPDLLAHAENVVGDLQRRKIPLPDRRKLNSIIRSSVRESLADSKELLLTVERFRGGFDLYDPLTLGRSTAVAQSFGQRVADRIERKVVEDGVKKGLLQPTKKWNAFSKGKKASRNAYLDGIEKPLDGTFRLQEGAPRPEVLGPRDPRMAAKQGSLSKSFLTYRATRKYAETLAADMNKRSDVGWDWTDTITFDL